MRFRVMGIFLISINALVATINSNTIELYSFIDVVSSGIAITSDNIVLKHNSPRSDSKVEEVVEIKSFAPDGVILQGSSIEVTLSSLNTTTNNLVLDGNKEIFIPHKLSAELTGGKETKIITIVNEIKSDTAVIEGNGEIVQLKAISEITKNSMENKPRGEYTNNSIISLKILAN